MAWMIFAEAAEPTLTSLFSPLIQLGFAGFSVLLLGFIIWLTKQLIALLKSTGEIIAANTQATGKLNDTASKSEELMQDLHDKLLSRPCMKDKP